MLQPLRLQHFLLAQKSNHSNFPGIRLFVKPVKPVCCFVLCLRQCPFFRCRHFVNPALERWIDNDNMPQRWNQRLKKADKTAGHRDLLAVRPQLVEARKTIGMVVGMVGDFNACDAQKRF